MTKYLLTRTKQATTQYEVEAVCAEDLQFAEEQPDWKILHHVVNSSTVIAGPHIDDLPAGDE